MRSVTGMLVGLAAALAAACGGSPDPTAQIRDLLAGAASAAEQRDTSYFRDLLGAAYRDADGNDREEMLRLIRGFFLTHGSVEVVSHIDSVELEGHDAARAVLHTGLISRRAGESLLRGTDGNLYRVELELVAQDGTWRVIGANWRSQVGD
jgi:hypothetical protein